MVAGKLLALIINDYQSVAVAVKRQADMRAGFQYFFCQSFGVQCAGVLIYICSK